MGNDSKGQFVNLFERECTAIRSKEAQYLKPSKPRGNKNYCRQAARCADQAWNSSSGPASEAKVCAVQGKAGPCLCLGVARLSKLVQSPEGNSTWGLLWGH